METKLHETPIAEFTVAKSNALIQAAYAMDVREKHFLEAWISQVHSGIRMPDNRTYTITIKEIKELLYNKTNKDNVYRDLKEALEKLYNRSAIITLPDGGIVKARFISSYSWWKEEQKVSLKFTEEIQPFLSELKNNFTQYKIKYIRELKSTYAIRVYEMLCLWASRNIYFQELTISQFRKMICIEDKYEQISEFKARVINPALKQINATTNFDLTINLRKNGRSFYWIQFEFEYKQDIVQEDFENKQKRLDAKIQYEKVKMGEMENKLALKKKEDELKTIKKKRLAMGKAKKFEQKLREYKDGTRFFHRNLNLVFVKDGEYLKTKRDGERFNHIKDFAVDFGAGILVLFTDETS